MPHKKHSLSFLLTLLTLISISQISDATRFYEAAVKASGSQKFRTADSLFTLAANLEPHPDTYFNRASVRLRLENKKGYCEDLACSSAMGDAEALSLFCKVCGQADTVFVKGEAPKLWQPAFRVAYKSSVYGFELKGRYNSKSKLLGFGWADADVYKNTTEKDSTGRVDVAAEFPGGINSMIIFIQSHLSYPAEAREAGLSGKVIIGFIVNSFGYLENIHVVKGMKDCKACDYEAAKLIAIMPRWTPAELNGVNVGVSHNLPLSYKIQ